MEEKLTTKERKCPKCGSSNIIWSGSSHVVGSGEPMRKADQFQYRCRDCDAAFWYAGDAQ